MPPFSINGCGNSDQIIAMQLMKAFEKLKACLGRGVGHRLINVVQ